MNELEENQAWGYVIEALKNINETLEKIAVSLESLDRQGITVFEE